MLYVLCGIPGSGKTTLSRKLADKYDAVLYCYDTMSNANNPLHHAQVRREMWASVANDLHKGLNVVLDDANILRELRIEMLSVFANVDCVKTIIVMQTPYDVCLQRNAKRSARLPDFIIKTLNEHFTMPTLDEGWDEIKYHKYTGGE